MLIIDSTENSALKILRSDWYMNSGLKLDQSIVEANIKNSGLERCVVCATELQSKDNFGNELKRESTSLSQYVEAYCPSCNYIVAFDVFEFEKPYFRYELKIKIFTNSKNYKLLADSGRIAEGKGLLRTHIGLKK